MFTNFCYDPDTGNVDLPMGEGLLLSTISYMVGYVIGDPTLTLNISGRLRLRTTKRVKLE